MFDEKVVARTGAGEQALGGRVLSQRDAWALTRIAEPGVCTVGIGNGKRLRIDLGGEACKGRLTVSELDCNTCEKWPGWSSSRATPPVFLQARE